MTRKPGMLISDEEITERFGDVLPKLDTDPATRAYQPYWGGKRFRPAVERVLNETVLVGGSSDSATLTQSELPQREFGILVDNKGSTPV